MNPFIGIKATGKFTTTKMVKKKPVTTLTTTEQKKKSNIKIDPVKGAY